MKLRKIFISLIMCVVAVLSLSTPVFAASYNYSSQHWWHPRRVQVIKNTRIYEIRTRIPAYKERAVKSKILKKGSKVTIENGGSGGAWAFEGKIPGIGKAYGQKYFWSCRDYSTKWFKEIR